MRHIIRLRGAWETKSSADFVRHSRNFGRPRTLETHERVWLVCQSMPGPTEVFLNGQLIGEKREKGPFEVEITDLLLPRNQIIFSAASSEPFGEVSIEIRGD
jgi:hypothetical protein